MNWYLKCLQQYTDFNGRARRKEYWMFFLINFLIAFALATFETLFGLNISAYSGQSFLSNLYYLAVLIPSIAVGVRRMHDVGKSGWFLLIPIYNLVLAVTEGQKGDNQYGADPKIEVV